MILGLTAKTRILDAAIPLFAEHGPLDVTLEDLRAEAGVSIGAVYHHFADKAAIYDAARLAALERYQAAFTQALAADGSARDGVAAIVRFHVEWCVEHRHAATLLLDQPPRDAQERSRDFFRAVLGWWRPHARYGAVRDVPLDLLFALWLGPATAIVRWHLTAHADPPSADVVATLADAAWMSLKEPS